MLGLHIKTKVDIEAICKAYFCKIHSKKYFTHSNAVIYELMEKMYDLDKRLKTKEQKLVVL